MSSLHRLSTFLTDHGHDLLDIWVYGEQLWYLRVISRKGGHLFYIGIRQYELKLSDVEGESPSPFLPSFANAIYYLERHGSDEEEDKEKETRGLTLSSMETMLRCALPTESPRTSYVLVQGNVLFHLNGDVAQTYRIRNLPSSSRK